MHVLAPIVPPLAFFTVYVEATPSATNETLTESLPATATVGWFNAVEAVIEDEAGEADELVLLPVGVTMKV